MRSDGQAMGSLPAGGGSSQTRGSQEHLGSAGRSDRLVFENAIYGPRWNKNTS